MTNLEIILCFLTILSCLVNGVSIWRTEKRVNHVSALVFDVHSGSGAQTQAERRQALLERLADQACAFVDEQAATREKRNQPAWTLHDKHHAGIDHFTHAARELDVKTDRGEIERYIGACLGKRRAVRS